jgi:hypothetical protein
MVITITLADENVPGLEAKRTEYNSQRKTNLNLDDFITLLLNEWSRHALTKIKSAEVKILQDAYNSASPQDKAKLLEQANAIKSKH